MRRIETPKRTLAVASVCASAIALAACTSGGGGDLEGDGDAPRLTGALTSFDSCDEALKELKANAKKHADSFDGYSGGEKAEANAEDDSAGSPQSAGSREGGSDHSGTNVQEEGVDEPDVVKTDGERIITLDEGRLYVVDAESEQFAGSVDITEDDGGWGSQLLLHGDRALVISPHHEEAAPESWDEDSGSTPTTTLTLVSLLKDEPAVINDYVVEGSYVDARAVDGMSRIVVGSHPNLPYEDPGLFEDEPDARKAAIDNSKIEDWLPRYYVNGEEGQVPCRSVARPSTYSGSSMLTILSFDLTEKLDDGSPLTIEADGQTVYGTGDALYVANDRRQFAPRADGGSNQAKTELFRFGLGGGGAPKFQASEKVPGYLLNQYSMSEWDGHLRVATTEQAQWENGEEAEQSSSTVYTLKVGDNSLERVGSVGGLGEGEQIKAVRFLADTGYVVTFRQTDPLYTIDLSNPEKPKTTGELKIPGYSAYLHPVSGERLIGVGKDGDSSGNLTGAQVGLYDVSDPADPTETDRYSIPDASSEVDNDPHAFLYWPNREYVIVPMSDYGDRGHFTLVLKIGEDGLSKVGTVEHEDGDEYSADSRSIVIGTALWTISSAGIKASDVDSLEEREWLSYE